MFLLFDIGGSNMRLAVSDGQAIVNSKIVPTPQNFDEGIKVFKQTADELSNGQPIEAIAGGIAGVLDKEKNGLAKAANTSGWIGRSLKAELKSLFGCEKVILENDADVEALGEAVKGAGVGESIVAYISFGTGIGSCRVTDGKIDKSSVRFESGHHIIVPDGDLCNCGGRGHFEAYTSGAYLERKYGQTGKNITDPKIWDEISRYVGIGLNNVTVHWSPDVIVLGGSVTASLPLDKVQGYLDEFLTAFPYSPKIVKATLGHDAGLYGALELLK